MDEGPAALHDKMPGFGIVRFDTQERTITMECWPRGADPRTDPQYRGWPRTITQADNDAREVKAWLPAIRIRGTEFPVVHVVDAVTNELVYARRATSNELRLGVFREGTYNVLVGEPETDRWKLLPSLKTGTKVLIEVQL